MDMYSTERQELFDITPDPAVQPDGQGDMVTIEASLFDSLLEDKRVRDQYDTAMRDLNLTKDARTIKLAITELRKSEHSACSEVARLVTDNEDLRAGFVTLRQMLEDAGVPSEVKGLPAMLKWLISNRSEKANGSSAESLYAELAKLENPIDKVSLAYLRAWFSHTTEAERAIEAPFIMADLVKPWASRTLHWQGVVMTVNKHQAGVGKTPHQASGVKTVTPGQGAVQNLKPAG